MLIVVWALMEGYLLIHFKEELHLIDELNQINSDSLIILIDENVNKLYGEMIKWNEVKKKMIFYTLPAGEKAKGLSEFEKALEYFTNEGVHRKSHLVAIGGGITSDFAGFIAATLLRGISWTVVPTTLLAMVDASIGGKVGLNLKSGKNLVGAFHQPQDIILSTLFLKTLPIIEKQTGMGEVLKYAFLDKGIYQYLRLHGLDASLIHQCAEFKQSIVDEDFKEGGRRKILNLGHTIGHAIEVHYQIPHGIAVVWGMVMIFNLYGQKDMIKELAQLCQQLNWGSLLAPWKDLSQDCNTLFDYIKRDKKIVSHGKIDLITVDQIGEPQIKTESLTWLKEKLHDVSKNFISL